LTRLNPLITSIAKLVGIKLNVLSKFAFLSRLLRDGLYCPVCKSRQPKFMPLPASYAMEADRYGYSNFGKAETINLKQYSCSNCGASDRERLYALFFDKAEATYFYVEQLKLLHFAPERAFSSFLRKFGFPTYRTADLGGMEVDNQIDIMQMQEYQDNEWDAFICSHVLEHVKDDAAALRELFRILKPNGWGILMVPLMSHFEVTLEDSTLVSEAERYRFFGQADHVRLYAKKDFLMRVTKVGFLIHQLGVEYFGADVFRRCGITSQSTLYVVTKPSND